MSNQPGASLRGAVDLSALSTPAPAPGDPATGPAGSGVRPVTDATFAQVAQSLANVPVVMALWATQAPGSREYADQLGALAVELEGRIAVLAADVDENPMIFQAFRPQGVPHVVALLAGQPVPLWEGPQPMSAARPVIDKLLEVALTEGITGRAPVSPGPAARDDAPEAPEEPLPEHLEKAYALVEADDLDGARAVLRQALEANPKDDESRLMLAQVELMARTRGADLNAVRAAAAANPLDVEAGMTVADLDVLGGHVEDAFDRLVQLVKRTSGEERNQVREHLVQLFDVVGPEDERVVTARRALMSALF